MLVPTVGRKVWYFPDSMADDAMRYDHGTLPRVPLDATVVKVWGPNMVNLAVLDEQAALFSRTSVRLVQDGEPLLASGAYCTWMPFQIGQSQRTEAAERALAGGVPRHHPGEVEEAVADNLRKGPQ